MIINFAWASASLSKTPLLLLEDRIARLLHTHRSGQNLLVVGRDTVSWCLEKMSLSSIDKSTLRRLYFEATQSGDLVRRARYYINIEEEDVDFSINEGKCIRIPIGHDKFHSLVSCPVVIVEDAQNDGPIIEHIIKSSVSEIVPMSKLVEGVVHGGGERIRRVAKQKIDDGRLIWLVVDSDKKSPSSCVKYDTSPTDSTGTAYPAIIYRILPCLEIENVVNLDIWSEVVNVEHRETLNTLQRIGKCEDRERVSVNDRYFLYFDMKRGLSSSALSLIEPGEVKDWIADKLRLGGIDPDNFIMQGFGNRLIKRLVDKENLSSRLDMMYKSKGWSEVFSDVIEDARWIFISPQPRFM